MARTSTAAPAIAPTTPTVRVTSIPCRNVEGAEPMPPSRTVSSKSTARIAPTGSLRMPSHFTMWLTRPRGRICRSIGPITVGPVITSSAPTRRANSVGRSSSHQAKKAESSQQVRAPTEMSRRMIPPLCRNSFRLRESPPSKRMTATAIEATGKMTSPKSASGSSKSGAGSGQQPERKKQENRRNLKPPAAPLGESPENDDPGQADENVVLHEREISTFSPDCKPEPPQTTLLSRRVR